MRFAIAAILAFRALGVAADEDIILQPVVTDASLPERLMIFMPGGLVSNSYYKLTAQAIQNATTGLRLTVVIPAVFQKLCIIQCPFTKTCSPLKATVDAAVAKSGFKSTNPKEDTFLAGHSLGATCANYLVQAYNWEYAGLLEFGGYVDMSGDGSLPNYSIPVLHMAGELDGGGARPGTLAGLYGEFKSYAGANGWDVALKLKPVQILEGLDHSDFCPGFFVTKVKDCKSEVTQDVAMARIGAVASAFLHLNSPTSDATKEAAMAVMVKQLGFTRELSEPYLTAFQLESGATELPSGPSGPWCETAQKNIVGLSAGDKSKLKVQPCTLITGGLHEFEHQHTNYTTLSDGQLEVTCFSAVEARGASISESQFSAKSVDCKMVDATRVAEQLHITTNSSLQCGDINRAAVEVALSLLPEKSKKRYLERGRKICYMTDATVLGNIGPLWVASSIKTAETAECLEVTSLGLVSTVQSHIFPGNHYCKLFSPAAAMDWMMTDSHKPYPYPSAVENSYDWTKPTEIIQI
jgi:hypothetical protein